MIISIQAKNWEAILDEVISHYQASYPVSDGNERVVGSAWLIERSSELIVLDIVQPGALKMWDSLGKNVIFIGSVPSDAPEDVLVVGDLQPVEKLSGEVPPDLGATCAFYSMDDDRLVGYIEEALGL